MEEKWAVIARDADSPFFRNRIWTDSFGLWQELFDLPNPRMGIASRNNDIEYLAVLSTWKRAGEVFFKRIKDNPDLLEEAVERSLSFGEELTSFTKKVFEADLSKARVQELASFYGKFAQMQAREYAYGILLPLLDLNPESSIEANLNRMIAEKLGAGKDAAECYSAITYPLHESPAEQQEEELLKLYGRVCEDAGISRLLREKTSGEVVEELRSHFPSAWKAVQGHASKWAWVYYVYAGPAAKPEDFVQRMQEYARKQLEPAKELDGRLERRKKMEALREKWIEKISSGEDERRMARLAGLIVWAKPRRKDFQSLAYYHVEKLFREISRRLDITLEQARSTPFEMLVDALEGRRTLDADYANQVKHVHVCVLSEGGTTRVYAGKEAQEFVKKHVATESVVQGSGVKEIHGTCACPGPIVTGKARIVNKREEIGKLEEGDVLVSIATTPAIVPAMRKAAAIVTEEGGLTCHAAIVSRELNKPCVVGTKTITRAVKDGDLLEVDALKGLVRIIMKA